MSRQNWTPELLLLNGLMEKLTNILVLYDSQVFDKSSLEFDKAIKESKKFLQGIDID